MTYRSALKAVDNAVDLLLGDDAAVVFEGVAYSVKGPLDRQIYSDETSGPGTVSSSSAYSVQTGILPKDVRGGYLSCEGEVFIIQDYDDPKDGRTVLMLERVYEITHGGHFIGVPFPFGLDGDLLSIEGYPYTYPIVGY